MSIETSIETLEQSINGLVKIAGELKTDITRFGAISTITLIALALIGSLSQYWIVTALAIAVVPIINLPTAVASYRLLRRADQNEDAQKNFEKEKERLENDLEVQAERAFDSLIIAKQESDIKISPEDAGDWVRGWKENLEFREIVGVWLKMPEALGRAFKAKYEEPGPVEEIEVPKSK